MDIKIGAVAKGLVVESILIKPTRGVTEEGITIYEDNLQLKLKNTGKQTFSDIDCKVEYQSSANTFLGYDSDGTFKEVKPNDYCFISIPLVIPDNTTHKRLTITADEAENVFTRYGSWALLGLSIIFVVIMKLSK